MGMLNMFATECSAPMAAKAETGNQAPTALPGKLEAAVASQTARQTSQLAIIPRVNACMSMTRLIAAMHASLKYFVSGFAQ